MSQSAKQRLDIRLVDLQLVTTRSQAESYIKLGKVKVDGRLIIKPGQLVSANQPIVLNQETQYVGRAALKLQSIAQQFRVNFKDSNVLDVGSSTGGFTDYSLKQGAKSVIAVEIGSDQLHPSLRGNPKIELHERTDIRLIKPHGYRQKGLSLSFVPDIVVVDLSFVSLRQILPHVLTLVDKNTKLIVLVKPQFEALVSGLKHKGVIKNEKIRRDILKSFELWAQDTVVILDKSDSKVSGSKGNLERFYLLAKASK